MMRLDHDDPAGFDLPAGSRRAPLSPPLPAVVLPSAPGGLGLSDGDNPTPPRPAPHPDGVAGNPAGPVLAGGGAPLLPTSGSPSAGNFASGTDVGGTPDAGSSHQIPGAAKGDISHG